MKKSILIILALLFLVLNSQTVNASSLKSDLKSDLKSANNQKELANYLIAEFGTDYQINKTKNEDPKRIEISEEVVKIVYPGYALSFNNNEIKSLYPYIIEADNNIYFNNHREDKYLESQAKSMIYGYKIGIVFLTSIVVLIYLNYLYLKNLNQKR